MEKKGLCRLVKDLKIRSSRIKMDPKSKDKFPCKRKEGKKMKKKIFVKTEADIGVMYLQVEPQRLRAATRGRNEAWN